MDCKIDHTFLPLNVTHCPECFEFLKEASTFEGDVEWDEYVITTTDDYEEEY